MLKYKKRTPGPDRVKVCIKYVYCPLGSLSDWCNNDLLFTISLLVVADHETQVPVSRHHSSG